MTALFTKVLDMSFASSIVILAVLLVRYLLRKSPKILSYVLWAVVLFRLLCPVSLTAPISLLEVSNPRVSVTTERTSSVSYLPAEFSYIPAQMDSEPEVNAVIPQPEIKKETKPSVLTILTVTWLVGVLIMVLHSCVSYLQLYRRLIGATPFRDRVYLADHIPTPFILGILSPRIYLPSDTPARERQYILAHEQHHIRRGDPVIKVLAYAALCLHWFNPLVWAAFFLAGKDMEMSCDEAVIRKLGPDIRADYAQTLLRLATHKRIIAGTPLAFGEGDTKGRVINMANWKKPKTWVILVSILLCIAVLFLCAVNPGGTEEKQGTAADSTSESTPALTDPLPTTQNSEAPVTIGLSLPADVVDVDYGAGEKRFFLTEPISGEIYSQVIPEELLGGIRIYDTPEQPLDAADMEAWLRALGVPQIIDGEHDWMASSGDSADLEVSFADAGGRETKHYYYIQEDKVFELWFDTDKLDAMTRAAILQSVTFAPDAQMERRLPMLYPETVIGPMVEAAEKQTEEVYLERCRTFLEELQSCESYSVQVDRSNYGGRALNDTSTELYYIRGTDWMRMISIPQDGILDGIPVWESKFGEMYLDGQYYDNMANSSLTENREVHWGKTDTIYQNMLWFHRFDWDAQDVLYVSHTPAGHGMCITFQVMAPYYESYGESYGHYFVNFIFDGEIVFQRAEITAYFHDEETGDYSVQETLRVTDREHGLAEEVINYEYQRFLAE